MPYRSLYNKDHHLVQPRKKSRRKEVVVIATNGTMQVRQTPGSKMYQVFDGKVFLKSYKLQWRAKRRIGL